MSKFEKYMISLWACAVLFAMFVLPFIDIGRIEEKRARECATLAAIGVKAGDHITIYGDMPTWKIACLMGDGDN